MDEFDKLKQFYKKHDKIQYLAMRVEETQKKLLIDDWALNFSLNKWSKNGLK